MPYGYTGGYSYDSSGNYYGNDGRRLRFDEEEEQQAPMRRNAYDQTAQFRDDEEMRRRMQLMDHEAKVKMQMAEFQQGMNEDRMRRGFYNNAEEMAGDAYGPAYQWSDAPTPSMPGSISIDGDAPSMFQPKQRTIAPDASKRLSLFREAGGRSGIPIDEFERREQIKSQQRVSVAQQINALKMEAERSGQAFDAAKAKGVILSRNPGGVDPATIDELLNPYIQQTAGPVSQGPAPTSVPPPQPQPAIAEKFTPEQEKSIAEAMALFPHKKREEVIAKMRAKGRL